MDFIERKAVKLLAQCARTSAAATAEALCLEPDRRLIRSLVAEIREALDLFEDSYFDDDACPASAPDTARK